METENIPLNAKVQCADGECGQSTAIVVNPIGRRVTHIVVEGQKYPDGRLVPLSLITGTTTSQIRLGCTLAEFEALPVFYETHYVKSKEPVYLPSTPDMSMGGMSGYPAYMQPVVLPAGTEVAEEVELLPAGERSINRGMRVEAKDGTAGEVGELLIDLKSGSITHVVLREGHAWGKGQVTLPLSAVDRVADGMVYLKLTKHDIETLPSVPIRRPDKHDAFGKDVELVAFVFEDTQKAGETLDWLRELHRSKRLKILSAAVLVKQQDGKTSVKEIGDLNASGGAKRGAIVGGALALLGPIGIVAGLVGGAIAGGAAAKLVDGGFKNKFLENAKQQLKPGTSSLFVVVEHDWVNSLTEVMAGKSGVVLQTALTDELVDQMMSSDSSQPS